MIKPENLQNKAQHVQSLTSKAFECGVCEDVGFTFSENERGNLIAHQCKCITEKARASKYKKLHAFAEMPEQLKHMKVKDYLTDIYTSEENRLLASKAKKIAINFTLSYDSMKETQTGLYFYSETKGSGKTRLAIGIGNALMERYGETVKFCTTTTLIQEIKATFNSKENTHSAYLEAVKNVPVLILDDIGTEKLTEWVNETFYAIINDRMLNKLITIYTSNCTIDELNHDSRIKSRIQGTTYPVKCPEEDIRVRLKKNVNNDIESLLLK